LTGAATITYGDQVTLGSRLTDEQTTTGIEGEQVNLFARRAGSGGELGAGTATTAADGAAAFTPVPAATTIYRASFPGSDTYGAASSPQVMVSVRPTVTARLQASTVTKSQTIVVTGSVAPNHHGQRVYLQRQTNRTWKGVASATLTNTSTYTLKAKPPATGSFTYRVVKRADADHTSATQFDADGDRSLTVRGSGAGEKARELSVCGQVSSGTPASGGLVPPLASCCGGFNLR
jgi:hypothetical protein